MNMVLIILLVKVFAVAMNLLNILKERANKKIELKKVEAKDIDKGTVRPAYAVLDNFILRLVNEFEMPDWKTSLDEYLKDIKED